MCMVLAAAKHNRINDSSTRAVGGKTSGAESLTEYVNTDGGWVVMAWDGATNQEAILQSATKSYLDDHPT